MRTTIVVPVGRATYDEYDTPQGWREAIQAGDLRRHTIVTVYRGDEPVISVPARQVSELDELFDELLGVTARKPDKKTMAAQSIVAVPAIDAANEVSSPSEILAQDVVPTDASVPALLKSTRSPAPVEVVRFKSKGEQRTGGSEQSVDTAPDTPAASPAAAEADSSDDAAIPIREPVRPKKGGVHPAVWIAVCVILLFVVVRCVGGLGDGSEQRGARDLVTVYAVRDVNTRRAASRSADLAGELDRGAQIRGRWVEGGAERWLAISGGTNDGAFVWAGNLSESRPPTLRGSPQTLAVRQAGTIHAAPDEGALSLQTVAEGQTLNTIGTTDTGWVEVTVSGAGVGYIPDFVFSAPAVEEPAASAEPAPTPAPARVCRAVREGRRDQLYCRGADGNWVAQGRPSPVRPEPIPEPAPTRPFEPPPAAPPTSSPSLAPSRTSLISRPRWLERPDGGTLARFIPRRALESGQTGRVGLDCAVNISGRLQDCRVSSEAPTGWGFGAAALRVPPYFRMATTDLDGEPTPGGRVRFAVTFAFEDG